MASAGMHIFTQKSSLLSATALPLWVKKCHLLCSKNPGKLAFLS
jgi:hypothetical protein